MHIHSVYLLVVKDQRNDRNIKIYYITNRGKKEKSENNECTQWMFGQDTLHIQGKGGILLIPPNQSLELPLTFTKLNAEHFYHHKLM